MNLDFMNSDFMVIYNYVDFDFGKCVYLRYPRGRTLDCFPISFQGLVHFPALFSFLPQTQLLFLQRLGMKEGILFHAVSISWQGLEVLFLFPLCLLFTGCKRSLAFVCGSRCEEAQPCCGASYLAHLPSLYSVFVPLTVHCVYLGANLFLTF